MKKRLRLLAWMLTLTMLCQMLPFSAFAQSDIGQELALAVAQSLEEENGEAVATGTCGDNLTWSLSGDGVLTISGTGEMYNYRGSFNTNLGHFSDYPTWYSQRENIKYVKIGQDVTSIGDRSFYLCTNLMSIIIPENATYIGKDAFTGCGNLSSVTIPDSVTSIGEYAFFDCMRLTSVDISSSVTSITQGTFQECSNLASIIIPSSVTSICYNAFLACGNLTSVTIPSSVTSIANSVFRGCDNLKDVYYAGSQAQWEAIDIDYDNDPLKNATIHYNSGKEDPDPNPPPNPDPDPNPNPNPDPSPDPNPDPEPNPNPSGKVFDMKTDGLSFLNNKEYFFNVISSEQDKNILLDFVASITEKVASSLRSYNISAAKYNQLTRNLSLLTKMYIKNRKDEKWGGSCYGIAAVSFLRYLEPSRIPLSEIDSQAVNLHDLKYPKNDSNVEDLINYYHLTQFLPTAYHYRADCITRYHDDLFGEVESIITELRNGNPVNVSISTGTSRHRILLLKIKDDTLDDWYMIEVYDSVFPTPQTVALSKKEFYHNNDDGHDYPLIQYASYTHIISHVLAKDLNFIDLRNFFGQSDYESESDYDASHVSIDILGNVSFKYGKIYARAENGELTKISPDVQVYRPENGDENSFELIFPKTDGVFELTMAPDDEENGNLDILLNDTLLSLSTNGPIELTYNESARAVDITANNPTDVNLMFTQNDPSEAWPWHSWAIDTTNTTEFHAKLDDEGLHLNGDGISNAKYATEYMGSDGEDDVTSKGTIPAGADNVTIINKNDGNGNTTDIETPDPVEPTELTVSVSGGTIIQINDDAFAESLTTHTAKQGDKITIMADTTDKFNGWIVNEGDVTLDDATAPTTTFTMGEKSVRITAEYQNNSTDPTPTPTPGGGSSSGGGGGGGGGGGAVLIGVGAAAAITAGVIMMSPVDIKGRVVLADQAAVPGAKISLLREGKVVAQTTADENGNFSLKAKRGSYELTAAYTNADGQLIYKTIDIKVPAKNLTVTF